MCAPIPLTLSGSWDSAHRPAQEVKQLPGQGVKIQQPPTPKEWKMSIPHMLYQEQRKTSPYL